MQKCLGKMRLALRTRDAWVCCKLLILLPGSYKVESNSGMHGNQRFQY